MQNFHFLVQSIVKSLKVSVYITTIPNTNVKMSSARHPISHFVDKSMDLNLQPIRLLNNNLLNTVELSYPLEFVNDVIVTHSRGFSSPLEKMFNFYGWLIIIATTIIILMTFVVIYLSNSKKKSKLSFTTFECLRLLINNSINTRMETFKMRIFFSVIFFYFLVIQATFSGHLAAFLTKPEYRKNVETLEDLRDPRYTKIYADIGTKYYITDELLLKKTIFGTFDCDVNIMNDTSVACVDTFVALKHLIIQYNLHHTNKKVLSGFYALIMRKNWPLGPRINAIIMRLAHSGVLDRQLKRRSKILDKVLRDKQEKFIQNNYYRPVNFDDVTFSFVLLAVGLVHSFSSFIVEMAIKVYKDHKKDIRMCLCVTKRSVRLVMNFIFYKVTKFYRCAVSKVKR